MAERADQDWPDEEGGLQSAAGLRSDTGASGDVPRGVEMVPESEVSVGTIEEGGTTTTERGVEGYGDLGSGTSGSAGSPESSDLKPGEASGGSFDPA